MRLAFVCHEFPPLGGGAATALENLTLQLSNLGIDILIVTIGSKNTKAVEQAPLRKIVRLGKFRRNTLGSSVYEFILSYFVLRLQAPKYLADFKPDAIVAFFAIPAGHAVLSYAKKRNIPLITSIRGADAPGFIEPGRSKLYEVYNLLLPWFVKKVFAQSNLVYSNGRRLQQLIIQRFPEFKNKIINLPNGVAIPSKLQQQRDKLSFLFVGQLISRKRVIEAMNALIIVAKTKPQEELNFTLVGSGMLSEEIKKLALTVPANLKVTMHDHLSREQLGHLYQEHKFLMHLSCDEGVSNTLLEAWAHGLIVFVAENVVQEFSSFQVPAVILSEENCHPQNIAKKIMDFMANPTSEIDFQARREQVIRKLCWQTHAKNFIKQLLHSEEICGIH